MGGFFSELTTIEKIYWMVTIVSSVVFLVQMISVFVLGDMDGGLGGDADLDVKTDTRISYQFFTLRNLVGFMTIFGWTGLGSIANGNNNLLTILISVIGGLLMVVLMTFLFYFISRLTESGNLNIKNAKGKTGSVCIPIAAKRVGIGKIKVKIQGSLRELDAVTDDEEGLKTGMVVTVVEVFDGNLLLVTKRK